MSIKVDVRPDGIVMLTLDRPDARNALDKAMVVTLTQQLADLAQRHDVRGLILRGSGKHFCAGIDLAWMQEGLAATREDIRADSVLIQSLYRAVYEFPRPTAAVIQGAAMAGGLGLACACDYVLAQKESIFSASETRIGMIPGMLLPLLVRRLGHGMARQIGALGLVYDAQTMQSAGLVSAIAESEDDLATKLSALQQAMLATSPEAVATFKSVFDRIDWGAIGPVFSECLDAMVDSRLSPAAREGLTAIAQRRPPAWGQPAKGAKAP